MGRNQSPANRFVAKAVWIKRQICLEVSLNHGFDWKAEGVFFRRGIHPVSMNNRTRRLFKYTGYDIRKFRQFMSDEDAALLRKELRLRQECDRQKSEREKSRNSATCLSVYKDAAKFSKEIAPYGWREEKRPGGKTVLVPRKREQEKAGGRKPLDIEWYEKDQRLQQSRKKWRRNPDNWQRELEAQRKRRQDAKAERAESQAAD